MPRSNSEKFWELLTGEQRRAAVVLFGLMLIGMVLETLGISAVMPALSLMTTKNVAATYPGLAPWLAAIGNPTQTQLVVGGMSALVLIFATKAVFLGFLAWRQARFAFGLQASLSERLFTGYLRQPWTFHLQRNSAELIRNATTEVSMFTSLNLSVLGLLTEGLVVLGISVMLVLASRPAWS